MALTRRTMLIQLSGAGLVSACGFVGSKTDSGSLEPEETGSSGTDSSASSETGSSIETGTPHTGQEDTASSDSPDSAPDTEAAADTGEEVCDQGEQPLPDTCEVTPPDGEGPFFREDVPERTDLNIWGEKGTVLVVAGRVLDEDCLPVAGAQVSVWHADQMGAYDNKSADYHARGMVPVDKTDGTFCFQTLRPPPYTDGGDGFLPAHLHINIYIDGEKHHTTQLYFEGDPNLKIYPKNERQVMSVEDLDDDRQRIRVDFVVGDRPMTPNPDG